MSADLFTEEHLKKEQLESFLQISQSITTTIEKQQIMQMIIDNATRVMGFDSGAIYMLEGQNKIGLAATTPPLPVDFPDNFRLANLEEHPHIERAIKSGNHIVIPDTLKAKLTPQEHDIITRRNLRSNLYLPIMLRGQAIGILILSTINRKFSIPKEQLSLLKGFAYQAAHVIDNVRNFESLGIYARELEKQISERKQMADSLKESEEKHRRLFETMSQGVVYHTADGSIFSANQAAERILGLSMDQMQGKTTMDPRWKMITEDGEDVTGDEHPAMIALRTGEKFGPVIRGVFVPEKNEYIWLSITATPLLQPGEKTPFQVYAVFDDISIQKQNEDRIKQQQLLINRIFEKLPIGIAVNTVKPEVRFEMMNENFARFYEVSREALAIPDAFWEAVYEDEKLREEFKEMILSGIESGDPDLMQWHDIPITKNGKIVRYISAYSIPLDSRDEVISTVMDVTARKHAEIDLIKAKEKAQESDRLKSAFLANMSHEIRTPMNAILGFSQLLKEPHLTGDQKEHFIDTIEKSGNRMLDLISDIMDISKIESGLMELNESWVNIHESMHYLYDICNPAFSKSSPEVELILNVPSKGITLRTDKEKLHSVIINLINNAERFTKAGTVEFGYHQGDEVLVFFVKDSGIGIPKDMQHRVFERFFQVDISSTREHEGSGLGLSIAKAFVELLGGEIWVESEQGKGSSFYFSLPSTATSYSNTDRYVDRAEQISIAAGKKHTILVVEDDEASSELIHFMLEGEKLDVLHAYTGEEGIRLFKERPDIDLILMDIKMPGIDGLETTRRIREFNKVVPIIAQTANALEGDEEIAIESGCNDYITKPIKMDTLLKCINKYI